MKIPYGMRLSDEESRKEKYRTAQQYIVIVLCTISLLAAGLVQWQLQKSQLSKALIRPGYGQGGHRVSASVTAEYEGIQVKKDVSLKIRPQSLSNREVENRLRQCEEVLEKAVLGENKAHDQIKRDLYLPVKEEKTGVMIKWDCTPKHLVELDGTVDWTALKKPTWVTLNAGMTLERQCHNAVYRVRLQPSNEAELYRKSLNRRIYQMSDVLSQSTEGKELQLPDRDQAGVRFIWEKGSLKKLLMIAAAGVCGICFVFSNRYRAADRQVAQYQEELKRGFPGMVSELVLLLNAGLVVTEAFDKMGVRGSKSSSVLEKEIATLCHMVSTSNASFSKELTAFAARTGVRELIRLAAVVNDNLDKGSELCKKLEAESQLAWQNRKKSAEEEGKKIEMKLTLPLVILLLIVVMITIAPVFLEIE